MNFQNDVTVEIRKSNNIIIYNKQTDSQITISVLHKQKKETVTTKYYHKFKIIYNEKKIKKIWSMQYVVYTF